jgi:ubiquinone/menaquinone biosynthesis C-methylase UbiE
MKISEKFLASVLIVSALAVLLNSPDVNAQQEESPDPSAYLELREKYEGAMDEKNFKSAVKIAEEINEVVWPVQWEAMYNAARAYCMAGDRRKAYEYLYWAIDSGYWDSRRMMEDEAFADIRGEKLFKKLARSARANAYIWMLEREEREEFQKPEQVMKALELSPGMRVADVGCGSGYFTVKVAKEIGPDGKIWAIDAWQDMLDHLERRLLIEEIENVELVKVEREDPQIPDHSADVILMVDVYHYIKERVAYGQKLRKGLAPGGRLIVIDYIPKSLEERPWGPPPRQHMSEEELTADLVQAGFKKVKQHDFLPEQYFVVYKAD